MRPRRSFPIFFSYRHLALLRSDFSLNNRLRPETQFIFRTSIIGRPSGPGLLWHTIAFPFIGRVQSPSTRYPGQEVFPHATPPSTVALTCPPALIRQPFNSSLEQVRSIAGSRPFLSAPPHFTAYPTAHRDVLGSVASLEASQAVVSGSRRSPPKESAAADNLHTSPNRPHPIPPRLLSKQLQLIWP